MCAFMLMGVSGLPGFGALMLSLVLDNGTVSIRWACFFLQKIFSVRPPPKNRCFFGNVLLPIHIDIADHKSSKKTL